MVNMVPPTQNYTSRGVVSGHEDCEIGINALQGRAMALNKPLRRLVLPPNFLKFGPLISSSHCRHSFSVHSGGGPLLSPNLVVELKRRNGDE